MKDQRLKVFRGALEGLIESLDALVRVSRWTEAEPPPEPLRAAAAKLLDRLGTAGRLSSGTFMGTPADTAKVNAMFATMKKLDAAYVGYRSRASSAPEQAAEAAATLEAEIAEATAGAAEWH